jgi:signal transduction histidine kinase
LLVGFYVLFKGRQFLFNRLFFAISFLFALWTTINLITWTNIHSDLILFVWSFFSLILGLLAISCIYFIYVFLDKKDISVRIKAVFLALLAPIFLLASTSFNLGGFNITACDAFKFEWLPFKIYYTSLGVLAMVWIFILLIRRYRTAAADFKKQIALMGIGIELFLFLFFVMIFLASYFTEIGVLPDSQLEMYGLIGMVIFIIYISILTVRFKTFNIKIIGAQALVWALVILIGSQFFYMNQMPVFSLIITGITLLVSAVVGLIIVRSVKKEVAQKEELANLNISLQDLLKQRESLVHLVTHKVKGSFTRSKYIFAGILDGTFGDINEEVKKRAEQGLESDNMGIETVDLVLNAANLEKGTVKYEMKTTDLKGLVLESISEKKVSAETKGLKLETEIGEETYNVSGDSFWLKEVVNNLIENSIKYTREGKITIGLTKKDNKVLFYVKDTGVGINPEDKNNLFTEGGRGKDSVKINVDSTGYGLYTVKLVIEAHKGKTWMESEGPNKGSTFFVELDAI